MAALIDGEALAESICTDVAAEVAMLRAQGVKTSLAVALVGADPASEVYVGRKVRKCRRIGIRWLAQRLAADTSEIKLLALIEGLNAAPNGHGVLVQLPLPKHIDSVRVLGAVMIARLSKPDGTTRLIGDLAASEADHARAVTPVPGGVGPMTIYAVRDEFAAKGLVRRACEGD